ncbi:MAG: GNAT family N-acetyltransferase [Pseudobdellovibrionaceae bacterium]
MSESSELQIREMKSSDLPAIKNFTDRAIGVDYYSMSDLEDIFRRSSALGADKTDTMCSLVLADSQNQIFGVRITYPPGKWEKGKGKGLTPEKWPFPLNKTAYFQSLFIDPSIQSKGFGKKMSLQAISVLKKMGAKAIVCHSWKDSPNDSSGKYLRSLGFKVVATHPDYWKDVDYLCTRCGNPPCRCTAEEMLLEL